MSDGVLGYGREAPLLIVPSHSSMGEKFISKKGIRMLLECQTSEGPYHREDNNNNNPK